MEKKKGKEQASSNALLAINFKKTPESILKILSWLLDNPDVRKSQFSFMDAAKATKLSRQTTHKILLRMQNDGVLISEESKSDRRRRFFRVSPAGEALINIRFRQFKEKESINYLQSIAPAPRGPRPASDNNRGLLASNTLQGVREESEILDISHNQEHVNLYAEEEIGQAALTSDHLGKERNLEKKFDAAQNTKEVEPQKEEPVKRADHESVRPDSQWRARASKEEVERIEAWRESVGLSKKDANRYAFELAERTPLDRKLLRELGINPKI